jgi:hypothetical protein
MIPLAVQMTRAVDGVVHVVDRLAFAIDDTYLAPFCVKQPSVVRF